MQILVKYYHDKKKTLFITPYIFLETAVDNYMHYELKVVSNDFMSKC